MNRASTVLLILSLSIPSQAFPVIKNIKDVDRAADKLKAEILSAASRYEVKGTTYFVSNDGDDSNDGLSEKTPFKSLNKVNGTSFKPGDVVLFRRGDLWRGQIRTRDGVTYSAYGKGEKPRLYGSPFDAAVTGEWIPADAPDVYVFSIKLTDDVGTLVFNHGADSCAYKVIKKLIYSGDTFHIETGEHFENYYDLHRDLDFYHDPMTGNLYLCSTKGNPAARFKSIELLTKGHCFRVYNNTEVTIDNFCIKYTGSHGIGASNIGRLTVTNCEIGWIGGSIQKENPAPSDPSKWSRPTRYGNGIEIWGGCDYYLVDHNYIYQVYDAGMTHQWGGTYKANHLNVTYSNNLVERCVYALEYFLSPNKQTGECYLMKNILVKNNILRMSGDYSWGYQRSNRDSPAVIKAWSNRGNRSENFRIKGNIIDRGNPCLLDVHAGKKEWMPECEGNIYIQDKGVPVGSIIEKDMQVIMQ